MILLGLAPSGGDGSRFVRVGPLVVGPSPHAPDLRVGLSQSGLPGSGSRSDSVLPSAPVDVVVSPGNGTAAVHWDLPLEPGASPITAYTVTASPSGASVTVPVDSHVAVLTGLMADCHATYAFTVRASNAAGLGPGSPLTTPVRTSGVVVPSPPSVAFVLLDGAPSASNAGDYYPLPTAASSSHASVDTYCAEDPAGRPTGFPPGLKPVLDKFNHLSPDLAAPLTHYYFADAFAAQGSVFFPYSYRGAYFPDGVDPTAPLFHVNAYDEEDSAKGNLTTQASLLNGEVRSIHHLWPSARIIVVGHSHGGLVAEQYWEHFWRASLTDHTGVSHVFSLDAPINGTASVHLCVAPLRSFFVLQIACHFLPFGVGTLETYASLWDTRELRDAALTAADQDGSFRPIGTSGDPTFDQADWPRNGLESQLLLPPVACRGAFPQSCDAKQLPNFVSPCPVALPAYARDPHFVVTQCPGVIEYIHSLVLP